MRWRHACARLRDRPALPHSSMMGAPRALTTTAARAQFSAKASTSSAIDARRPSASRPIQPIASQVTPVFRLASFGVRASAPAASHSLTAKGVTAAAQHGKPTIGAANGDGLAVIGDKHIGSRRRDRPETGPKHQCCPAQAQRRAQGADEEHAGGSHQQRASAERLYASYCPRQAANPLGTQTIQSMPPPMRCQNTPSKPKGIATTPRIPIGITATKTTSIARRFAKTP